MRGREPSPGSPPTFRRRHEAKRIVTIVHCADVHLETSFTELRGGKRRRAALADAFGRVVDLALERGADALTVGGDLFEAERAGPQTFRFLAAQFARFGRPVFVAPGNHDPYSGRAPFANAELPQNVRVFDEARWLAFALAEDVTIFGFAHTPAEPGPPFAGARFDRSGARIALVHGSDADRCPPRKRLTAPFTARAVEDSGATFLLSGHYHGGYVAARSDGRSLFAYPGSLEPIKFGENGAHGALVLRVDGMTVEVEHVSVGRTRVHDVACDLTGAHSEHDVIARIEIALAGLGLDDYVRLRLCGAPVTGTRVDAELIGGRFDNALGTLDVSDATVAHDYERLAREPTVRGHVVRDLLDAARDGDGDRRAEAIDAIRYALAAFDGDDIAP